MKSTSHPPCDASSHMRSSPRPYDAAERQDRARRRRLITAPERDREAWLLTATAGPLAAALADAAHAFVALEAWRFLGFARLGDFAREKLDRTARWVNELAALGKRMAETPALRDAIVGTDGGPPLLLSAALKIARAPDTRPISEWIELGRRLTVRELQKALDTGNDAAADSGANDSTADASAMAPGRWTSAPGEENPAPEDILGDTVPEDEQCSDADAAAFDDPEALAIHGVQIRLSVPRPIRACFYETLDLHRAVTGTDATVVSFLEAITAEAAAGPCPPDLSVVELRRGISVERQEAALARVNDRWRQLSRAAEPFQVVTPRPQALGPAPQTASERRDRALEGAILARYSTADMRRSHSHRVPPHLLNAARVAHTLSLAIHVQDHVERELAEVLLIMSQHGDWTTLGFRSLGHYARERLGLPQRTAESRTKMARELRWFPRVRSAYCAGHIGREAARILVTLLPRRATEEQQALWIAHARCATVKRLRDELQMLEYAAFDCLQPTSMGVAGLDASGVPEDPSRAGGCAFPGQPPSDAEWHQSLHRAPGRTHRRLQRCMPVWDSATPSSHIDSANVFLTFRMPVELARSFAASLEAARRALSGLRPEPRPGTPERLSHQFARAYSARCRRVPTSIALLALLEDYALTWDDPASFPRRRWHLTYVRDGWRCMAPGCTSRQRMDCHHIDYRSHQGSNELWNLLTVCRFHHQQGEHGGYAHIRGTSPDGVLWRLGAAGLGEWYRNEIRLAA